MGQDCLDSRDFPAKRPKLTWFFELPALLLKTEMKHFLLQFALAGFQFFAGQIADFFDLHTHKYWLGSRPVAGDKLGADWQLVCGETQRFPRHSLGNAIQLE